MRSGYVFQSRCCHWRWIWAGSQRWGSETVICLIRLGNWTHTWCWISSAAMVSWKGSASVARGSPTGLFSRNSDRGIAHFDLCLPEYLTVWWWGKTFLCSLESLCFLFTREGGHHHHYLSCRSGISTTCFAEGQGADNFCGCSTDSSCPRGAEAVVRKHWELRMYSSLIQTVLPRI